jgi:hypothetical protein
MLKLFLFVAADVRRLILETEKQWSLVTSTATNFRFVLRRSQTAATAILNPPSSILAEFIISLVAKG